VIFGYLVEDFCATKAGVSEDADGEGNTQTAEAWLYPVGTAGGASHHRFTRGYVGPRYFAQVGKAEQKVARAQIDAFEKALHTYRLDVGHYPPTSDGLAALNVAPPGEAKWQGPLPE